MRIAVGGFHIESCTFSPLKTTGDDFYVQRGEELIKQYEFFTKFPEVSFIPLVRARAIPGGPVDRPFYESIKEELISGLQDGKKWDGVFLHMHGSVYVDGLEDAEGDMVRAIREIVGKDCILAASYDLHGNVSQRVIDNLDILSAYRTAPHVDWYETLERVCTLLINCINSNSKPYLSFVPIPILLPGEQTSTEWEPASRLYSSIPEFVKNNDLLDASILIGYVWADEPRSSASVITIGFDFKKTQKSAEYLANKMWEARHEFQFGVPTGTVDDCIKMGLASKVHPVFISDSGDNPTAGGVGDITYMLERLLFLQVPDAVFASIMDEESVEICEKAGVGAKVSVSLGGKLDKVHGRPLNVQGVVMTVTSAPWSVNGSSKEAKINKLAVLQVDGIKVVVTKYRTPFHYISDFQQVGIEPNEHMIVVVKIGYLEPELKQAAAQAFLALSPGAVNQNIKSLDFKRISRPMFPFNIDMEWSPNKG
jgi:microcystin degradation protein MlrC